MSNHYFTLGLQFGADIDEIKRAYRKLALTHHPDKNQGNEKAAQASFVKVQAAYDALTSEPPKTKYADAARGTNHTTPNEAPQSKRTPHSHPDTPRPAQERWGFWWHETRPSDFPRNGPWSSAERSQGWSQWSANSSEPAKPQPAEQRPSMSSRDDSKPRPHRSTDEPDDPQPESRTRYTPPEDHGSTPPSKRDPQHRPLNTPSFTSTLRATDSLRNDILKANAELSQLEHRLAEHTYTHGEISSHMSRIFNMLKDLSDESLHYMEECFRANGLSTTEDPSWVRNEGKAREAYFALLDLSWELGMKRKLVGDLLCDINWKREVGGGFSERKWKEILAQLDELAERSV